MEDEEYISSELQGVLEEFTRIRDAYVALHAYCEIQEETMVMGEERSKRMKESLEKISNIYMLLEKRYKTTVVGLQNEKESLLKIIDDLKERCDHLSLINIDRNASDDEISILRDEIEVLKAQLLMQEEKHNEDVTVLKQQHSDELQRYKVLLQNAKLNATSNERKRGRSKSTNEKKKNTSFFRWPQLNIAKVSDFLTVDEVGDDGNDHRAIKKRKLFFEEADTPHDII